MADMSPAGSWLPSAPGSDAHASPLKSGLCRWSVLGQSLGWRPGVTAGTLSSDQGWQHTLKSQRKDSPWGKQEGSQMAARRSRGLGQNEGMLLKSLPWNQRITGVCKCPLQCGEINARDGFLPPILEWVLGSAGLAITANSCFHATEWMTFPGAFQSGLISGTFTQ